MRSTINDIDERWRRWRDENPGVYELFKRFARQALEFGRRFGIKALTERVRWEVRMTWSKDERGFRINNDFTAYIARDLIHDIPALEELIEIRRVRGGDDQTHE